MTVQATPRIAGPFFGNDTSTEFPFDFKVFSTDDIQVSAVISGVNTVLTLGADYSVTLNADQGVTPGGTVTYPLVGAALATGDRLTMIGALPYDQTLSLPGGGNFNPRALENQLDRTTIQQQQLLELAGRTLTLPPSYAGSSGELPPPQPGAALGWDVLGQSLTNVDPSAGQIGTLLADFADETDEDKGSALMSFIQAGLGAVGRRVRDKLRERISAADFGAVGDGSPHPLSERFSTLTAAQAVYPHVTSLTQSQDWAAIQAALNHAATIAGPSSWDGPGVGVEVTDGSHYINDSLRMNSPGICLYGVGRGARLFTDLNIELIVMGDPTDTTSVLELHVQNLFLVNTSSTNTGTGIAMYRAGSGTVTGCTIRSFYDQISTHRSNRMMVLDTNFNADRTTKGGAHIRISGSASGNGGGMHVANCEIGNSSGALLPDYEAGILVENVDGLYLTSVHTRDVNYGLLVAPNGTTGKNSITEILGVNCYFDESYESAAKFGGTIAAGGLYQNIRFVNTVFRCGNASGGTQYGEFCVDIDVQDAGGFASGGGTLQDFAFLGGHMRQARQSGFRAIGATAVPPRLEVSGLKIADVFFRGHNVAGATPTPGISVEAESTTITGNEFAADAVAGTQCVRVIVSSLDSLTPSVLMHDNDASNSNCTGDPFAVTVVSGAMVSKQGNLRPGRGKRESEDYKTTTDSRGAKIIWSALVEPEGQMGIVHAWVVGSSTSGTAGSARAAYEVRTAFYRQASGNATLDANVFVRSYNTITNNDYPVALKLLTGVPWVASAAATAGDMITSGGNVYLALLTGTLGASAPVHTDSTVANGTVPLAYLGPTAINTLALIVTGQATTDMVWMASVDYRATP